jgi:hypothetical protein
MPTKVAPIQTPLFTGKRDSIITHPVWVEWFTKFLNPLFITSIKSGATQAAAGAVAGEVWKTKTHATLPDNVLMIGV